MQVWAAGQPFKGHLLDRTVGIIQALLAMAVATRFISQISHSLDVVAAVSFFAAGPSLLIAGLAAWRRAFATAGVALLVAVLAVTPLLPSRLRPPRSPAPNQEASVVLVSNLQGKVQAWQRLLPVIREELPDIVGLCEINDDIIENIVSEPWIRETYPFQTFPRPGFEWTQVILSRHTMRPLEPRGAPSAARVMFSYWRASIIALPPGEIVFSLEHLPSPRSANAWALGNDCVALLGVIVRNHFRPAGIPILIAGDFNATPTSYRHRLMRTATGLFPDDATSPPGGTWPSWLPGVVRLPLDRAWGSEEIVFTSRRVLRDIGSDHRPVAIGFCLR